MYYIVRILRLQSYDYFPNFPRLRLIFFIICLFADNNPGDRTSYSSISRAILNSSRSSG